MPFSKHMPAEERRLRQRDATLRYNERHPERRKETVKLCNQNRRETHAKEQREWLHRLRETPKWEGFRSLTNQRNNMYRKRDHREAIDHYGGQCYCCGEQTPAFLALDHIGGGGTKHRKALGSVRVEAWAKRNGWPSIFRVACHNCNFGAHLNGGFCPHLLNAMSAVAELASSLLGVSL